MQEWAGMLAANPKLRDAWDGFTAQLAKDAALIGQGVQLIGQALATAAGAVHEAADDQDGT